MVNLTDISTEELKARIQQKKQSPQVAQQGGDLSSVPTDELRARIQEKRGGVQPEKQVAQQPVQPTVPQRKGIPFDVNLQDIIKLATGQGGAIPQLPGSLAPQEPQDITRRNQNVAGLLQREESLATAPVLGALQTEGGILDKIKGGVKATGKALTGEEAPQLGDVPRELGAPEGVASTAGFVASLGLPSNLLLGGPKILKPAKAIQETTAKSTAFALGRSEALKEAKQIGFRKVLQERFFDKNFPAKIQQRIESNISNLAESAADKFKQVVEPFKNTPVQFGNILTKVNELASKALRSPFKTGSRDLVEVVRDGVNKFPVKNFDDLLNLRRFLDDVLFDAKGQVKVDFGKQVRNIINDVLHSNPTLREADKLWTALQQQLKNIGKKVTSDTGENFLKRFDKLTQKQKGLLSNLEKEIGGEPFIDDLTNFSVAQKFATDPSKSLFGLQIARDLLRKGMRGGLRTADQPAVKGTTKVLDETISRSGTQAGKIGVIESERQKARR